MKVKINGDAKTHIQKFANRVLCERRPRVEAALGGMWIMIFKRTNRMTRSRFSNRSQGNDQLSWMEDVINRFSALLYLCW